MDHLPCTNKYIVYFSGHPDLKEDIGEPIDDHPSVHQLFEAHLPGSHPNIDDLLEEGYTLPSWHPDISKIVLPRSLLTSPASILGFAVGALLIVIALARAITKWRNSKRTKEIFISNSMARQTSGNDDDFNGREEVGIDELPGVEIRLTKNTSVETSSSSDRDSDSRESVEPSGLDQTRNLAMIRRDFNPNEERILVYKEKTSNWKKVFGRRVMKSSHSTGEAIICVFYILINVAALWISPTYAFGVGFGSLSVGNTLFLFMTAARNSFLSWVVGVAFEQVLVYHRFIGRVTVLLAFIHSCFYINDVIENTSDPFILTGIISLGCGFVIVLSSLNVIRRKFFNIFFWSHYSFIGFLVGLYLHALSARPFIIASVACYGIDKGLQMMWKLPRQTTVFKKVDDRTAHVQFEKPRLSSLLGRHKVGQYVFVNFPSLSLQEWHVSCLSTYVDACSFALAHTHPPYYILCTYYSLSR